MADTSLGEGIGLQSGHRSDYWMRRLADDERIDDARKREDEKQLIKDTDIDIDYKEHLPVYGNMIKEVYKGYLNDVAKARQGDPHISRGKLMAMSLDARQKINEISLSNQRAKAYIADKEIMKDENLVGAFIGTKTTPADLQQFNRGGFLQLGPDGEFAYKAVSNKPIGTKFDLNTDYTEEIDPKVNMIGGKQIFTKRRLIAEDAIQRESAQLSNRPDFINQVAFNTPGFEALPDDQKIATIAQAADAQARSEAPRGYEQKFDREPYHAPAGDSASKKVKGTLQFDTTATMRRNVVPAHKGADGTIVKETFEEFQLPIKISQAVQTKAPTTVQTNPKMIDAVTNKTLEGSKGFDFRPSAIVVMPVRDNPKDKKSAGKWKQYVLGSVVQTVNGNEVSAFTTGKNENEKIFNVLIPYEGQVKSSIESNNETGDYESHYQELIKPKSGGASTLPTVNSQAEYDALPKGTKYIDSEGTEGTKK